MSQPQPRKRDALTRNQLTGFVSEISLEVNPDQLQGICALHEEAGARNDNVTMLMYEYVESKLRHAAGNGGQTHCSVRYDEFIQACAREGIGKDFADTAWQDFCRPFVA